MLARSDRDFMLYDKRPSQRRSVGLIRRVLSWAARRPAPVIGLLLFIFTGLVVALNALAWQQHRHPAPIGGRTVTAAPLRIAPTTVRILPPSRPSELAPAELVQSVAVAQPATISARDPIGDMIRTIDGRTDASPALAGVQKALNKLGYGPLAEDGLVGPGTRAALDRFKADHGLPGGDAIDERTRRALSETAKLALP
jgi:hypothetical protein